MLFGTQFSRAHVCQRPSNRRGAICTSGLTCNKTPYSILRQKSCTVCIDWYLYVNYNHKLLGDLPNIYTYKWSYLSGRLSICWFVKSIFTYFVSRASVALLMTVLIVRSYHKKVVCNYHLLADAKEWLTRFPHHCYSCCWRNSTISLVQFYDFMLPFK